jgi:hypothetical protein
MRRIFEVDPVELAATIDADNNAIVGYQQKSLRATSDYELDFETCFEASTANAIIVTAIDETPALPTSTILPIPSCSVVAWQRRMIAPAAARSHMPTSRWPAPHKRPSL